MLRTASLNSIQNLLVLIKKCIVPSNLNASIGTAVRYILVITEPFIQNANATNAV